MCTLDVLFAMLGRGTVPNVPVWRQLIFSTPYFSLNLGPTLEECWIYQGLYVKKYFFLNISWYFNFFLISADMYLFISWYFFFHISWHFLCFIISADIYLYFYISWYFLYFYISWYIFIFYISWYLPFISCYFIIFISADMVIQ